MLVCSRVTFIAFVVWGSLSPIVAKTFYVSNTGSNSATGESESASWLTIANAVSKSTSGDVVNLKRGDVFRENAINLPNGVSLGAYGTGTLPVVSGAAVISGWTAWPSKSGVFYAAAPQRVDNLFVNGTLMTIARYPNSGFLRTTSNNSTSTIVGCTALTQNPRNAAGYWDGCRMRWRHWNFATTGLSAEWLCTVTRCRFTGIGSDS